MTEQVKKRAKFEYAIGSAITALIVNYVVRDIVMPAWAQNVLLLMVFAYFLNWAFQLLEHFIENEVNNRAAEAQLNRVIKQQMQADTPSAQDIAKPLEPEHRSAETGGC